VTAVAPRVPDYTTFRQFC